MSNTSNIHSISYENFRAALDQYPSVVPAKLEELDEQRYGTVPAAIAKLAEDGEAYMTKAQLVTLVEWKLSHGKFRPSLKKLILDNTNESVESITRAAFTINDPAKASIKLCTLRGVGPATASLLLSVHDPENVPFFSDELFRWCVWEDGAGHGWDRPIKYRVNEYAELRARIQELRDRLGTNGKSVSAVNCEKVAYSLERSGVDVNTPVMWTLALPAASPEAGSEAANDDTTVGEDNSVSKGITASDNKGPSQATRPKTTKKRLREDEIEPGRLPADTKRRSARRKA